MAGFGLLERASALANSIGLTGTDLYSDFRQRDIDRSLAREKAILSDPGLVGKVTKYGADVPAGTPVIDAHISRIARSNLPPEAKAALLPFAKKRAVDLTVNKFLRDKPGATAEEVQRVAADGAARYGLGLDAFKQTAETAGAVNPAGEQAARRDVLAGAVADASAGKGNLLQNFARNIARTPADIGATITSLAQLVPGAGRTSTGEAKTKIDNNGLYALEQAPNMLGVGDTSVIPGQLSSSTSTEDAITAQIKEANKVMIDEGYTMANAFGADPNKLNSIFDETSGAIQPGKLRAALKDVPDDKAIEFDGLSVTGKEYKAAFPKAMELIGKRVKAEGKGADTNNIALESWREALYGGARQRQAKQQEDAAAGSNFAAQILGMTR